MDERHLSQLLDDAASRRPDHPAVEDEHGRVLTYAALWRGADRLATRLARWGVGRGDRVGLWLPKSLEAVTAIHGVLRMGASYVPVDPTGPVVRGVNILGASGVKAAIVSADLATDLHTVWSGPGPRPRLIVVDGHTTQSGGALGEIGPRDGSAALIESGDAAWPEVMADCAPAPLLPNRAADDLAYVLFTSGSTGKPKGVMLSHANAFTFLDWCDEALGPWRADDRFASHAPFHFDLSVFDLFASCSSATTLVLIGEVLGKDPSGLADFLRNERISVWYSSPSILSMLTQTGTLERLDINPPRLVLFAGEVFPIAALRRLRAIWPRAAMWNLYGPTETNVCTAYPIPAVIPANQTEAFPIGRVCKPLRARVVEESGRDVAPGHKGELIVAGPGVMRGYFGQHELTQAAFFVEDDGTRWYRTGDVVHDAGDGCFHFHGRRDRMVKKRGYRIELGEIESALYRHDGVDRAGVVAQPGEEGVSITAFVALKPSQRKSIIAMKRHCIQYLPNYMIPDQITFLDQLPATSTDKVDYQSLKALALKEGPRP
ncbi:MAG: amino acid adenylation domain-containing protein [Isosphaeraceae bacterium]